MPILLHYTAQASLSTQPLLEIGQHHSTTKQIKCLNNDQSMSVITAARHQGEPQRAPRRRTLSIPNNILGPADLAQPEILFEFEFKDSNNHNQAIRHRDTDLVSIGGVVISIQLVTSSLVNSQSQRPRKPKPMYTFSGLFRLPRTHMYCHGSTRTECIRFP
jgi:hypothetical protein